MKISKKKFIISNWTKPYFL